MPNYACTGTLSPDATGTYAPTGGTYNNHPTYSIGSSYYLWCYADNTPPQPDLWVISTGVGYMGPPGFWMNSAGTIEGSYNPNAGASGTATVADAAGGNVYTEIGSGGLALGGSAAVRADYSPAAAGGLALGGSADVGVHHAEIGSGGLVLGGSATDARRYIELGSGGLAFSGAATWAYIASHAISGGLALGGSADVQATYSVVGSGGLTFSGTVPPNTYQESGSGGLTFGGAATWSYIAGHVPSGGLSFGGTAAASMYHNHYVDVRGVYRVWAPPAYRFYRAQVAPPSESDTPFATAASLPATPAEPFSDGTWYVSVSYFNGCLDSGFLPDELGRPYQVLTVSGGTGQASPPQGPTEWRLALRPAGVVHLDAFYYENGGARADTWAIAYTVDGTDPAADSPTVEVPFHSAAGLEVLSYDLPAQAHGTTVKVRLQTQRGDPAAYSAGSTVQTATADAAGPTAPLAAERWPGRLPEES